MVVYFRFRSDLPRCMSIQDHHPCIVTQKNNITNFYYFIMAMCRFFHIQGHRVKSGLPIRSRSPFNKAGYATFHPSCASTSYTRPFSKPGTASKLRVANSVVYFEIPTSAHRLSKPSALLMRNWNLGKSASSGPSNISLAHLFTASFSPAR